MNACLTVQTMHFAQVTKSRACIVTTYIYVSRVFYGVLLEGNISFRFYFTGYELTPRDVMYTKSVTPSDMYTKGVTIQNDI